MKLMVLLIPPSRHPEIFFRGDGIGLNLPVASEDVYRKIIQEYLDRESLSTDWHNYLLSVYFLIKLIYSFSPINLFILHAC